MFVDVARVPIDWGQWAMYCHILEHVDAGMMTLEEVGDADSKEDSKEEGP
ncbi:MAG: multicopper oxidase domain-containing protein [bacterium]|nr:multicopper oxidase domain-containing protein [bacterium]MCP5070322.1 multicopper oxidase domain-containing protein [bacterium]